LTLQGRFVCCTELRIEKPDHASTQIHVRLTTEGRAYLKDLIHTGSHQAAVTLIHARILLKADVGPGGPGWDADRITEAIECSPSTVYRVRQVFVEEGIAGALFRKKPAGRLYRKLDGAHDYTGL